MLAESGENNIAKPTRGIIIRLCSLVNTLYLSEGDSVMLGPKSPVGVAAPGPIRTPWTQRRPSPPKTKMTAMPSMLCRFKRLLTK